MTTYAEALRAIAARLPDTTQGVLDKGALEAIADGVETEIAELRDNLEQWIRAALQAAGWNHRPGNEAWVVDDWFLGRADAFSSYEEARANATWLDEQVPLDAPRAINRYVLADKGNT